MTEQLFESRTCPTCNGAGTVEVPAGGAPPVLVLEGFDQVTREAIQRVDEAANEEWKALADAALYEIARTKPILMPDDLWDHVPRPREPRAAGPVFLRARRAGWITPTGNFVRSRNVKQHRTHITEYESLIYRLGS